VTGIDVRETIFSDFIEIEVLHSQAYSKKVFLLIVKNFLSGEELFYEICICLIFSYKV
tara:strand:+ start:772 stop:945 length:174 start_codon:yes stop_codon:yes gene_type:complete